MIFDICLARSLCWRVLLNVLPSSSVDWVASLESTRSNFNHFQVRQHSQVDWLPYHLNSLYAKSSTSDIDNFVCQFNFHYY